jgi:hypothetical protein
MAEPASVHALPPLSKKPRTTLYLVIAVGVAVVLIASAVLGAWMYSRPDVSHLPTQPPATTRVGPSFSFSALYSPNGQPPWFPAANAWATVTSSNPSVLPSVVNFTNATGENDRLILFQGETGLGGVASGSFAFDNWTTVNSGWPEKLTHVTSSVSLTLEASFQAYNNSTRVWDLYTYYNAIPFDPWSPPLSFSASAYFDLATPAGNLSMLAPPQQQSPSNSNGTENASGEMHALPTVVQPDHLTCPQNPQPTWKTNYDAYVTGPFPIFMLNDTQRHSGGFPAVAFGDSWSTTSTTVNFTGAGGTDAYGSYSAAGGVSTTWVGTTASSSGATGGALSEANYSFGMLYYDNVTLHAVRTTETLYYYSGLYCKLVTATVQRENTAVVNETDSAGLTLKSASVSQSYGRLIYDVTHQSFNTITNVSTPTGGTAQGSYMVGQATGFSNAESIMRSVTGTAAFFLSTLDLAFTIMDAADACGIFCDAIPIATTVAVMGDVLGIMQEFENSVSSFAYTTTTNENLSLIHISAVNGPFNFQVIGSHVETQFCTAKGTVDAEMPNEVVAW